jgi:hypothetical protein
MRESIVPVRLLREQTARPRRVRSLWATLCQGSIVDVENNRERERGLIEWMRCRVHRQVDGQLWVIPVSL